MSEPEYESLEVDVDISDLEADQPVDNDRQHNRVAAAIRRRLEKKYGERIAKLEHELAQARATPAPPLPPEPTLTAAEWASLFSAFRPPTPTPPARSASRIEDVMWKLRRGR